jgi:hypothetical protein
MQKEKPNVMRVYLSNKDKNSIEAMAKKSRIKRHMLLSYAVRYFLANYRLGNVRLDPTIQAGKMVLDVDIDLDDGEA